jgi:periplasmic protein CpxP/Spy
MWAERENRHMHTLKATILLGALVSAGMLTAQAPDASQAPAQNASQAQAESGRHHHAPNPDKQAKHLAKQLGLTKDQEAQIEPILADRQQRMESLRADGSLAPQDRLAKAQTLQQDAKSKIEAVLNDDQKQKFEQMQAERRAHHNHGEQQGQQG